MRRNSLYERLARAGLEPNSFRRAEGVVPFATPDMSGTSGPSGHMSGRPVARDGARKISSAPVTSESSRRSFPPMQKEAATPEPSAVPIRTAPSKPRPLQVWPDNQDRLRDAKRRLCAAFNVESNETLLLNQFIEERLDEWVSQKMAPPARKAEKGTK